jgi:hypothetical protein
MAKRVKATVKIDRPTLNRALTVRNGPVGKKMASLAALSTIETKKVALERTTPRTRRHINSIKSTTEQVPEGTRVVTSSIHYGGAPEKATRPHIIRPRVAKVLRFETSAGEVVFARSVRHPGTKAQHILRDGVKRAGRRIARLGT